MEGIQFGFLFTHSTIQTPEDEICEVEDFMWLVSFCVAKPYDAASNSDFIESV